VSLLDVDALELAAGGGGDGRGGRDGLPEPDRAVPAAGGEDAALPVGRKRGGGRGPRRGGRRRGVFAAAVAPLGPLFVLRLRAAPGSFSRLGRPRERRPRHALDLGLVALQQSDLRPERWLVVAAAAAACAAAAAVVVVADLAARGRRRRPLLLPDGDGGVEGRRGEAPPAPSQTAPASLALAPGGGGGPGGGPGGGGGGRRPGDGPDRPRLRLLEDRVRGPATSLPSSCRSAAAAAAASELMPGADGAVGAAGREGVAFLCVGERRA